MTACSKAKSLGEKLFDAFGNEGWANRSADNQAMYEAYALAFAASLTHDETANATITALRASLEGAEGQRDEALEALKPFAEIAARYPTGGLKADIDQRSPDVVKLLDASAFYRAASVITKGGADV